MLSNEKGSGDKGKDYMVFSRSLFALAGYDPAL
jgi:hypothetical protein